jgi:hypothetical protein
VSEDPQPQVSGIPPVDRFDLASLATVSLPLTETQRLMTTLRIEHEVHASDLWKTAFDGYADVPPRVFCRTLSGREPATDLFSTEVPF